MFNGWKRMRVGLRVVTVVCLGAAPAFGQCALSNPASWNIPGAGDWFTAGNWNPASVPNNSNTNVCITNGSGAVTLGANAGVASLQLASGNGLIVNAPVTTDGAGNISVGQALLSAAGPSTISGTVSLNAGALNLSAGGAQTNSLAGTGTVTLTNLTQKGMTVGTAAFSGGILATGAQTVIQGDGQVNFHTLTNGGLVNANVGGGTLILGQGQGTIANAVTLEATQGGTLAILGTVNNTGGIISTDNGASLVTLNEATVQGGTLNGNVQTVAFTITTLDGSTQGALTNKGALTVVQSGQANVFGTLNNTGTIQLNGNLVLTGATKLTGGGSVTLSGGGFDSNGANLLLDNADNTIQGKGYIGVGGGPVLTNESKGFVIANVSGQVLQLGSLGGVTNAGTIEATNGGILRILNSLGTTEVVTNSGTLDAAGGGVLQLYGTVNNATGTISTDTGNNSVAKLFNGADIEGGILNGNVQIAVSNSAVLDGSTHGALNNQGTLTVVDGSAAQIFGTMNNTGAILLNSTGGGAALLLTGNTKLTGGGTVTLSGSASVYSAGNGVTLDNVNNTIQGAGQIGLGYNVALNNESLGIIRANVSGQTLILDGTGGVMNTGAIQAINGGNLQIGNTVNNAGGTISTDANTGSVVTIGGNGVIQGGTVNGHVVNGGTLQAVNGGALQIGAMVNNAGGIISTDGTSGSVVTLANGTVIQGGTLRGNVQTAPGSVSTLDGSTQGQLNNQGTFTVVNGSRANVFGIIENSGAILLNTTSGAAPSLSLTGNTTLAGGGTVTLSTSTYPTYFGANVMIGGNGMTLENGDNTIQGAGDIGYGSSLALKNDAGGVISANMTGASLFLNGTGGVVNTGVLQAINGGNLEIDNTVNNLGGTISTDGTAGGFLGTIGGGGSVTLDGGAVIQGGTLNGNIQLAGGTLDGSTQGALTNQGSITIGDGSQAQVFGTLNNSGTILLFSRDDFAVLNVTGNTTLTGGGTLTLFSENHLHDFGGPFQSVISTNSSSGVVLDNIDNVIQANIIGNAIEGANLTLKNEVGGIVNAAWGGSLSLNPGLVINAGTIEATFGGALQIGTTVNNLGGTISTDGGLFGAVVTLGDGAAIQGGTLNGNIQTAAGTHTAILDGSTQGALNNQSVFTVADNSRANVFGTMNNTGGIVLNSAGNGAQLNLTGNTALTGGGAVTLADSSHSGGAIIYSAANNGAVLDNVDNTIQGEGHIGNGSNMSVLNEAGGIILANSNGQTLYLDAIGGVTNNGTLQVAAGSTLQVASNLTNFSGNTLTGGTYTVQGTAGSPGTLVLASIGTMGGEIVHNAAAITLDGPTVQIVDGANLNALAEFQDNLASGGFTVENGQTFSTAPSGRADFQNAGSVDVGPGSSFDTADNYVQTGGSTKVDGALTAEGGLVSITGGTLSGSGTVNGSAIIGAGVISPGDSPGTIRIDGDYSQYGTLREEIGGAEFSQYDHVLVSGKTVLEAGSTIDILLVNGFVPAGTDVFGIFGDAGSEIEGTFTHVKFLNLPAGDTFSLDYSNPNEVMVDVTAPDANAMPEPVEFLPLLGIGAALMGWKARKRVHRG